MSGSTTLRGCWLLLIASCLLICACSRAPPEQALRTRIDAMSDAVQQRQVGDFMDAVAEDFVGNGGLDRRGLQRLLQLQVLGNALIGATIGPIEVTLRDDRAEARFEVLLTGGSGRLLPERASAYRVVSGWRRDGDDWLLYSAQWEPVGGG